MKIIQPMKARLFDKPFDDPDWIFEIKWDGYRGIAYKHHRKVELFSRQYKLMNATYPHIATQLQQLPGNWVLDGEIVALDKHGLANFQLLQNYQRDGVGPIYYYVFDIMAYNGKDLTKLPLLERKAILLQLLEAHPLPHIRYTDHIEMKGKQFFKAAVKQGLEGIMAKKASSTYQSRRSDDWLKLKSHMRQEVVIGGFTQPRGSRTGFGALLVGVYEGNKLVYAGHVGTGFDTHALVELRQKLQRLERKTCPFVVPPAPNMPVTWVKPQLVCEVAFAEWTSDNVMRQPTFKGIRTDKDPKEVIREHG